MPSFLAGFAVVFGSLADIAIGAALLWRPWARRAALASVALAGAYLAAATLLVPELWASPLGPLAKIIPVMLAGLFVAAGLEER